MQILDFIPKIYDNSDVLREPSELKDIKFSTINYSRTYFCVLNSNLFYWFFTMGSDCRNLNKRETNEFFIDLNDPKLNKLNDLAIQLSENLELNSEFRTMKFTKVGQLKIQCFFPKLSKPIIDEIDKVLAQHYGFSDEELDFIINYDIKYRMGKELDSD